MLLLFNLRRRLSFDSGLAWSLMFSSTSVAVVLILGRVHLLLLFVGSTFPIAVSRIVAQMTTEVGSSLHSSVESSVSSIILPRKRSLVATLVLWSSVILPIVVTWRSSVIISLLLEARCRSSVIVVLSTPFGWLFRCW